MFRFIKPFSGQYSPHEGKFNVYVPSHNEYWPEDGLINGNM